MVACTSNLICNENPAFAGFFFTGLFTLCELVEPSPLTEEQVREALNRMVETGRLMKED